VNKIEKEFFEDLFSDKKIREHFVDSLLVSLIPEKISEIYLRLKTEANFKPLDYEERNNWLVATLRSYFSSIGFEAAKETFMPDYIRMEYLEERNATYTSGEVVTIPEPKGMLGNLVQSCKDFWTSLTGSKI
jgi:hypothetical protein